MAIQIPPLDPVLISLGPIVIRWYALAYLAGFLLGWKYCLNLIKKYPEGARPNNQDIDDFLTWAVIGVIVGGRLGYVLFYQNIGFLSDPFEIFRIWHGGMSFHGGLLGVIIAAVIFARRRGIMLFKLSDMLCAAAPIGLFFGRIANFINMELVGRQTDLPWGVILPGQALARHPSQIYEAILEGLVLFFVLRWMMNREWILARHGLVAGAFLILYGIFRALVEFVRQPDYQVGFVLNYFTMGQILCLPMIFAGVIVILLSLRAAPRYAAP